jgi:hypothetical protein
MNGKSSEGLVKQVQAFIANTQTGIARLAEDAFHAGDQRLHAALQKFEKKFKLRGEELLTLDDDKSPFDKEFDDVGNLPGVKLTLENILRRHLQELNNYTRQMQENKEVVDGDEYQKMLEFHTFALRCFSQANESLTELKNISVLHLKK